MNIMFKSLLPAVFLVPALYTAPLLLSSGEAKAVCICNWNEAKDRWDCGPKSDCKSKRPPLADELNPGLRINPQLINPKLINPKHQILPGDQFNKKLLPGGQFKPKN